MASAPNILTLLIYNRLKRNQVKGIKLKSKPTKKQNQKNAKADYCHPVSVKEREVISCFFIMIYH